MADLGLLGAIGEGLKAGTEGFKSGYDMRSTIEARKQSQLDAVKQRKLQALVSGYKENETGDDFMKTPEQLAKEEKADEQKRIEGLLGSAKEGLLPVKDETGKITRFAFDPNSAKGILQANKLESDKLLSEARNEAKSASEALKKSQQEPKQHQYQSAKFAASMDRANKILETIDPSKYDPTSLTSGIESKLFNPLQREEAQQYANAKRAFINNSLRDESGASIQPSEFISKEKELFPQPGDSQKVIANKKLLREASTQAMIKASGPAWETPENLVIDYRIKNPTSKTNSFDPSSIATPQADAGLNPNAAQIEAAKQYLKQNPKAPDAELIKQKIMELGG